MIRKRVAFAVLTLTTLLGSLAAAVPAMADHDDYGGGGGGYYGGGGGSYYGGSYGSGYRGDYCRPRYRRSYSRSRPRIQFSYSSYDDRDYRPRYRQSYSSSRSRYRCGCGDRFASAYWLDYHRDHTRC